MNKWVKRIILLLIILGGFALRAHQLDRFSFWLDEGLTPLRSSYPIRDIFSNVIIIQAARSQDTHPPLYYLLIHFTRQLFGTSDFAFRYPSVLFSVLLIPLLFRFGRKLSSHPLIGLLSALLVALNPQQIWYAQEARMYPQLVLLMAIASYILWGAWQHSGQPLWKSMAYYAVFAALAAYTHYTALFLIVGHALVWLWLLWRAGQKMLIVLGGAGAALVVAPFAPFVVKRLLGPNEASYYPVAPPVFFADIVRGFGFGRTVEYANPLIFGLLLVLTAMLLYGIWSTATTPRTFLLIYLLSAVFGLLIGSYVFKPMYLGAHHIMVGSAAFILLLALSISQMPWSKVGIPLALGSVLLVDGLALSNFYFDTAYAKEDYRALVQFVEARAGENDLVVYNDAILLPLHQHYQQRTDLPFTASPLYPYSLDDARNPEITEVIADYARVWFVPAHPSDGRDDEGVVEVGLHKSGQVFAQQPFHGRNADVSVTGYAIGESLTELPSNAQLLAETDLLKGITVSAVQWQSLWVDLFWAGAEQMRGQPLAVQLRDPSGGVWASSEMLISTDDITGDLLKTTHGLLLPVGLPPATYQLWLNHNGWRQVNQVEIIEVISAESVTSHKSIQFDNGLELISIELAAETVFAGNPIPATLLWRIHDMQALRESQFDLAVVGQAGELRRDRQPLLADWISAENITTESLLAQKIGVSTLPNAPAGTYRLLWQMTQAGQAQGAGSAEMGEFTILEWPFVSEIPAVDNPVDSVDNFFSNEISLRAFSQSSTELSGGDTLDVKLFWHVLTPPAADWSVFVHLVKAPEDQPLAQANGIPVNGFRVTTGWRTDEIISDPYQLQLPADLAAGTYTIYVGFFNRDTFTRLPVTSAGTAQPYDQFLLTTITVK